MSRLYDLCRTLMRQQANLDPGHRRTTLDGERATGLRSHVGGDGFA